MSNYLSRTTLPFTFMTLLIMVSFTLMVCCLFGMAYTWSFTDTTFGGVLGTLLPPLIGVALFILGHIHGSPEIVEDPMPIQYKDQHGQDRVLPVSLGEYALIFNLGNLVAARVRCIRYIRESYSVSLYEAKQIVDAICGELRREN